MPASLCVPSFPACLATRAWWGSSRRPWHPCVLFSTRVWPPRARRRRDPPGLRRRPPVRRLPRSAAAPLCLFLHRRRAPARGPPFIRPVPRRGCQNRRIHSHKVFAGVAQRGRSSVDWFFGFKRHFIINDTGELVAVRLTPGQVDDRTPVPDLAAGLWGKLFGDRGYVSQKLFDELWADGVQLVTRLKRRMKNRLVPLLDDLLLRKRGLIECVGDQLKNLCQIEHTRHRSPANAFVNIIAALVAYCLRPSKPSLGLTEQDCQTLVSATI